MSETVQDITEAKGNRTETLRRLSATITEERLDRIIDGLKVRNAFDEHPDTFYEERLVREYGGFLFGKGKLSTSLGKVHFVNDDSWLIMSELFDVDWYKPTNDGRVIHITAAADMKGNDHPAIQVLRTSQNGHEGQILPLTNPDAIQHIAKFLDEIDVVEAVVDDYCNPANRE